MALDLGLPAQRCFGLPVPERVLGTHRPGLPLLPAAAAARARARRAAPQRAARTLRPVRRGLVPLLELRDPRARTALPDALRPGDPAPVPLGRAQRGRPRVARRLAGAVQLGSGGALRTARRQFRAGSTAGPAPPAARAVDRRGRGRAAGGGRQPVAGAQLSRSPALENTRPHPRAHGSRGAAAARVGKSASSFPAAHRACLLPLPLHITGDDGSARNDPSLSLSGPDRSRARRLRLPLLHAASKRARSPAGTAHLRRAGAAARAQRMAQPRAGAGRRRLPAGPARGLARRLALLHRLQSARAPSSGRRSSWSR